jgi:cytochrome P450
MIERWEPRIAAVVDALITQARAQGKFDLIHDIAAPLPVVIVAEMLGVPPADAALFTPWTRALAALIEYEQTPEIQARGAAAMNELADYLRAITAARRAAPQDDLISALLTPPDDDPPTEEELLGSCTQLLFGGNDPVAHLIGNAIWTLLHHPDQHAWLAAQPNVPLSAVDELMRYDSSVQMTFRYALTDVTWGDKRIKTGDLVAVVFGAANRDPAAFAQPDTLYLQRTPNRHLSLGQGIHYCLGASLARTEGRIVLRALTQAFPRLRLLNPQPMWQRTVAVRGLQRLPVAVA